jgi:hypothetical protein
VPWLFDHLHPAAIQLYGEEGSWLAIDAQNPDPSYAIEVIYASGPASWIYKPAAGEVTVQDVYTVYADVTGDNQTAPQMLHFGWVDGQLYWFANFGSP